MKSLKDTVKCYEHCSQGVKQPPKMIEFKLRSGDSSGYSYSWLYSWTLEGDHTLRINITNVMITLKGLNLEPIVSQLRAHMLVSVSECEVDANIETNETIVLSIESEPINNDETSISLD